MMKSMLKFCAMVIFFAIAGGTATAQTKIFNGENLKGWECDPAELADHWKANLDGYLYGENPDMKGSILWTTKKYFDFMLELEYKALSEDYDTGVFLHGDSHQVQIGISRSLKKDMTGCIYAPQDNKGAYPGQTDKVADYHMAGEWNHLMIIVEGKRIQT